MKKKHKYITDLDFKKILRATINHFQSQPINCSIFKEKTEQILSVIDKEKIEFHFSVKKEGPLYEIITERNYP